MAWIESHTEVERHRKMILMAQELGIKRVHLSGHIHCLWHNVLEQQEDGDLSAWPDELIADIAEWEGDKKLFVELLRKYNWLEKNGLLHDWLDYAGRYLTNKYRSGNPRKLKMIFKKHKSDLGRTKINSKSAHPTTPNHTIPNQDNLTQGRTVAKSDYPEQFQTFWSFYPRRMDKQAAFLKWKATLKRGEKPEDLILAAKNYQISTNGTEERYIKHPATFLGPTEPWREYLDGPQIPQTKQDLQRQKMEEMARRGLDEKGEF